MGINASHKNPKNIAINFCEPVLNLEARQKTINVLHKKISCPWDKKGQAMRFAIEETKGKKAELIDGVKIYIKDSWVLLIPDAD